MSSAASRTRKHSKTPQAEPSTTPQGWKLHQSQEARTIAHTIPEGVRKQDVDESDGQVKELLGLRKQDKRTCRKLGEIWGRIKDTSKDGDLLAVRFIATRYGFSTRTVYLYLELARLWDSAVAWWEKRSEDWQVATVNEFMDAYKSSLPEDPGKRGPKRREKAATTPKATDEPPAQQAPGRPAGSPTTTTDEVATTSTTGSPDSQPGVKQGIPQDTPRSPEGSPGVMPPRTMSRIADQLVALLSGDEPLVNKITEREYSRREVRIVRDVLLCVLGRNGMHNPLEALDTTEGDALPGSPPATTSNSRPIPLYRPGSQPAGAFSIMS